MTAASGVLAQAASAPAKHPARYRSTIRFTGTRKGKPTLKVTVSDKVKGGRKITRVVMTLPRGFTFRRTEGHVRVVHRRFESGARGRTLTIDPRTAATTLTIEVNHRAIRESHRARAAGAGKVKLRVTERPPRAKHGGGGGSTGKSACGTTSTTTARDLEGTVTGLVGDLKGLLASKQSLGGLLGDTVTDLGHTVCSLGTDISGVGSGKSGAAAQKDVTAASADLKSALNDLRAGKTSAAETKLRAAAGAFQSALQSGSKLSGSAQAGLTALEGYATTIANALEAAGAGGTSGSNPAGSLESALTALEAELTASNPLSGLLGDVVGELETTLSGLVGDLTGVGGDSPAGTDLSAAASELQTAITDLQADNTSGAQAAFESAAADVVGAIQALGSSSSAGASLAGLEAELTSLASAARSS